MLRTNSGTSVSSLPASHVPGCAPNLTGEPDAALQATAQLSFTFLGPSVFLTGSNSRKSLESASLGINERFQKCLQGKLLFQSDTTKKDPFVLSVPIRGSPMPRPVPAIVQRDKTRLRMWATSNRCLSWLLRRRGNGPVHKDAHTSGQVLRATGGTLEEPSRGG